MSEETKESEFGSGLVVCLLKFSEHFMNSTMNQIWAADRYLKSKNRDGNYGRAYDANIESFKSSVEIWGSEEKAFAQLIETWANGATDHLYDLRVPDTWANTELSKKVKELQDKGLKMGHGFTGELYTTEDISELRKLVTEIGLEIDKQIGIKNGDWGKW